MVIPLLLPRSKLLDAVGDPVNAVSLNAAHEAVEPAVAAMLEVVPGAAVTKPIIELELPTQLNALVTVWVPKLWS